MRTAAEKCIKVGDSFAFDYGTMFGKGRLTEDEVEALAPKAEAAAAAVAALRATGRAKAHKSKDGTDEPVLFTRLPYICEAGPNTPASIAALCDLGAHCLRSVDGVVFLGVGGSYLGNKVLFNLFCGEGWNSLSLKERGGRPYIFFGGNNLGALPNELLLREIKALAKRTVGAELKGERFRLLLVPISKSGGTLETLTAFSYLFEKLSAEPQIDAEVTAVTDLREEAASPLARLAALKGWRTFDIKEGVGGRFSVFHAPGLVTAAVIGCDIEALLRGARDMDAACKTKDWRRNPALLNACLKYAAGCAHGCDIEVFMGYGQCLKAVGEWYVQLLAESLGKRCDREGRQVFYGRTPIAAVGSTDMHAQTQQHQDGRRNKVIQFLQIKDSLAEAVLGAPFPELPDIAKYAGLNLNEALEAALFANRAALDNDGRFSAVYTLARRDEYCLGLLLCFLMLSIAYEGELADVDAYDQPGVEAYKKIIKRELGR